MDDTDGKMFLVKQFDAHYQEMGAQDDPTSPSLHMVVLQFLCEVGGPTDQRGSPVMFLKPDQARELGQRLIREAKLATESSRGSAPGQKKRH